MLKFTKLKDSHSVNCTTISNELLNKWTKSKGKIPSDAVMLYTYMIMKPNTINVTREALSEATGMCKAKVSKMLKILEENGYLARIQYKEDGNSFNYVYVLLETELQMSQFLSIDPKTFLTEKQELVSLHYEIDKNLKRKLKRKLAKNSNFELTNCNTIHDGTILAPCNNMAPCSAIHGSIHEHTWHHVITWLHDWLLFFDHPEGAYFDWDIENEVAETPQFIKDNFLEIFGKKVRNNAKKAPKNVRTKINGFHGREFLDEIVKMFDTKELDHNLEELRSWVYLKDISINKYVYYILNKLKYNKHDIFIYIKNINKNINKIINKNNNKLIYIFLFFSNLIYTTKILSKNMKPCKHDFQKKIMFTWVVLNMIKHGAAAETSPSLFNTGNTSGSSAEIEYGLNQAITDEEQDMEKKSVKDLLGDSKLGNQTQQEKEMAEIKRKLNIVTEEMKLQKAKTAVKKNIHNKVIRYVTTNISNPLIQNALLEYIDMRDSGAYKQITEAQLKIILKNLYALSNDVNTQVAIIEQSTVKGYLDFYPLSKQTVVEHNIEIEENNIEPVIDDNDDYNDSRTF